MYIGAYWGPRSDTRSGIAEKLERILAGLGRVAAEFQVWHSDGRGLAAPHQRAIPSASVLEAKLSANRGDFGGLPIPELGLSILLSNGRGARLSSTMGITSAVAPNNVVLDLASESRQLSPREQNRVADLFRRVLVPEDVVVSNA